MTHVRNLSTMMASVAFPTLAGPALARDGADVMKKLNVATNAGGTSSWEKALPTSCEE